MTTLPDKPSELIRLAIGDLEKCEADERYAIDMYRWHRPNGQCAVCLAGAVMAKSLNASPDEHLTPWTFANDEADKFDALDNFRLGGVRAGVKLITGKFPEIANRKIAIYEDNPAAFKRDMLALADYLEKHNL